MAKVVSLLKQIQADSLVFFVKTHNLHWNVKGLAFKQIHEATEEIYEQFADVFDDVAERILQLGDKPIVTISEALKTAKIKEESKTKFSPADVVKIVLKDFEYFEKSFVELSNTADDSGDKITADYANGVLANLQKSIWMLKAQLG